MLKVKLTLLVLHSFLCIKEAIYDKLLETKYDQLACRIIEEQGSLHAIVVLDFIGKNISLYVEMINMFSYHTLESFFGKEDELHVQN